MDQTIDGAGTATNDAKELGRHWTEDEGDPFRYALLTWLEGKPKNTQRSYRRALADFFNFISEHPRYVLPAHVAAWKASLKDAGLSDSTVAQRLSALSSYFQYLATTPWDVIGGALAALQPGDKRTA